MDFWMMVNDNRLSWAVEAAESDFGREPQAQPAAAAAV